MPMVMGLDRVVAMEFGRKIAEGTPAEVQPTRGDRGLPGDRRMTGVASRSKDSTAGYGPVEVLHDVDPVRRPGRVVVILGANGAGKTTTIRAISGTILREGDHVRRRDITQAARAHRAPGVAQVPQGRGTFLELTVEDNLRIGAYTRGDSEIGRGHRPWFERLPPVRATAQPGGGACPAASSRCWPSLER